MAMDEIVDIFGLDFTSRPSARKPVTCVRARFDGKTLAFQKLTHLHDFAAFEAFLSSPGPWAAGIDFPFGQSRRFVENIGWPGTWAGYVEQVSAIDRAGFRKVLEDYKRDRPPGDKQHKRTCDVYTRSQSPQTLYGTPVALMFYEGAPRLLQSGVHLPYHRDGDLSRIVVEAYPGVCAREFVGKRSYKNDSKQKQTIEQYRARLELLAALTGRQGERQYGFAVRAPKELAEDPGGDDLDALICAVQAAWACRKAQDAYGAPAELDRLEGWIADPALLRT